MNDDDELVLQTDLKMNEILIIQSLIIHICMKIDKIMIEWSIDQIIDHWFEIFHWFKRDYECLSIRILFERWE
jgi:hypothetical protein